MNFDKTTNEFTYEPYTAPEQGGAKGYSFIVWTANAQTVNVTFDAASAAEFGVTKDTLKEDTNVFYLGSAATEKKGITVKIDKTVILGEGA